MLQLYKTIVRPTLEYCNAVWRPTYLKDQDLLEKVQQRATRLIPDVKHLSYEERLKTLKLPSLEYRRQRADLLQIYKIMHGLEAVERNDIFEIIKESRTRGHRLKIRKPRCKSKMRQMSFSVRSINNWNNLPEIAINASSINKFKSELENHWKHHPLKYHPYQRESNAVKRGT